MEKKTDEKKTSRMACATRKEIAREYLALTKKGFEQKDETWQEREVSRFLSTISH